MRRRTFFLSALALTAATVVQTISRASAPAQFVVIVHPGNPTSSVNRKFLGEAFLKKTTRWDHGETIKPVDQVPDSAVRRAFSEQILKRSVAAVRSYWQQVIFAGNGVPPPELNNDDDVVQYVLKHAAAVGYVSSVANLNGAKVVSVD